MIIGTQQKAPRERERECYKNEKKKAKSSVT
jgi:hypothetical protein